MNKRTLRQRIDWSIVKAKFSLYGVASKMTTPRVAGVLFGISKRIYRYQSLAPAVRWLYSKLVYDDVVFLDPGNPTWLWAQK